MKKEILRIEHLSKVDISQKILRSVSFYVLESSKTVLLSNPLEKETILNILFEGGKADTGKIFVDEKLCTYNIAEHMEQCGIFHISAKRTMIPTMTVSRNFLLCLPELIPNKWIRERILFKKTAEILEDYRMYEISPKDCVESLTYFQILCLEIIIATQKGARLLVLDDVFNNLGEHELRGLNQMLELLYSRRIGVLFFANRYYPLFNSFDSLVVLQNGVTIGVLEQDKITFPNFIRYYSPIARRLSDNTTVHAHASSLCIRNRELELEIARGEILGIWSLDGKRLMQIGRETWKVLEKDVEIEQSVAVSFCMHGPDNIYKAMTLVDNITYLANGKVCNALGMINKRLQYHMAEYALGLIHSEVLLEKYRTQKMLKKISQIDQMKVVTAKWLCVTPQLFVYINPFIALDEATLPEFQEMLRHLTKLNITVIIISVNRGWLELTCDRIMSVD